MSRLASQAAQEPARRAHADCCEAPLHGTRQSIAVLDQKEWCELSGNMMIHSGRHFLQIPGPTNVPERVLRAMDRSVIDHRGPEFARLTLDIVDAIRPA